MSPIDSNTNTNATVEQLAQWVSGPPPADSDLSDWSKGHLIYTTTDWPVLLLNDAIIIAGVSLIVWIILRKKNRL